MTWSDKIGGGVGCQQNFSQIGWVCLTYITEKPHSYVGLYVANSTPPPSLHSMWYQEISPGTTWSEEMGVGCY